MEGSDDDQLSELLFLYMKPFDISLWLLILTVIIVVSVWATILGRISPYGWYLSPPEEFSLWEAQSQMRIDNTLWQTLSTVLQQGT